MDTLFFPGIGGGGAEEWPSQAAGLKVGCPTFLSTSPIPDGPSAHADAGLALASGDLNIIGHSYGGIASILAAGRGKDRVRSLALFEPSCLGISAHLPATSATIEKLRAVWAEYSEPPTPAGLLAARFFENVHGEIDPENPVAIQAGKNLRAWGPPWVHPLDLKVVSEIPTLVITGAWSDTYEEIGQVLAEAGARHVQLAGFDHGPQNHPDANAVLEDFWASTTGQT
ncbi:MAG: alpha/beta hydrolase [Demequinaceae bacterium]|nr:alpha/beta hydrolase [Demequinaceae bacterium]